MIPFSSSHSDTRSPSSSRNAGSHSNNGGGSIRPRNRRLISTAGEQELVSHSGASTPGGSGSRGVSPIPRTRPSRGLDGELGRNGTAKGGGLRASEAVGGGGSRSASAGASTWGGGWMGGWSAIQGIATSVLGGTEGKGKTWGPEMLPKQSDGGIGAGTTAEREAKVRRKKMARVLEGRDEPPSILDTSGNLKRRTSTEELRPGSSQNDDGDALVYIHHVQPSDTLVGVILRYNCQPAVFRKANRFWPNDSIQIRKVVVLPVDACTIKGRPCDPPSPDGTGVDLLAPTPGVEEPPSLSNGTAPWPTSSQTPTSAARSESHALGDTDTDEAWTHVRWVLLDSSPNSKPTQIARMPRKTLGYFPPRRRKSHATMSTTSTPRVSSDLSAFPSLSQSPGRADTPLSSTPTRRTSNLGHRPNLSITSVPGSYFPPPAMTATSQNSLPTRSRKDSINSRNAWMTGPGGVGTLGPKVRTPGPAKDSMNSWVRKTFPHIAIDSLPSAYAQPTETARLGFSSTESSSFNQAAAATANTGATTPVLGPNGLGIENAAAAVEGWIRRMAVKGVPGTPLGGARARDEADLIELLDGTGSDDGHGGVGFELSPGAGRMVSAGMGGGREDLEGVVRGRGRRAGTRGKSGKSD